MDPLEKLALAISRENERVTKEVKQTAKDIASYTLPLGVAPGLAAMPFFLRGDPTSRLTREQFIQEARKVVPNVQSIEIPRSVQRQMGGLTAFGEKHWAHRYGGGPIKGRPPVLGLAGKPDPAIAFHELGHATAFKREASGLRRGLFRARLATAAPVTGAALLMPFLPEKAQKPVAAAAAVASVPLLAEEAYASIKGRRIAKALGHSTKGFWKLIPFLGTYAGMAGAATYPLWRKKKS